MVVSLGGIDDVRNAVGWGTVRRFLTLLCFVLAACLYMFYVLALAILPGSFSDCLVAAGVDPDAPAVAESLRDNEAFIGCRAAVADRAGRAAVLATGVTLLAAAGVYWWLPTWRQRTGRLIPAASVIVPTLPWDDPQAPREPGSRRASLATAQIEPLSAHLTRLAAGAGLRRAPLFVVDPRAMTAGAVAFGRAGRYVVCLDAGLIPLRVIDPRMFDAVLLHELAHLRGRDVDIAYLVIALWRVILLAVLVPFVAIQGWSLLRDQISGTGPADWGEATPGWTKLLFGGFLAALVYLVRTDIFRKRELCADLDAVAHGADPKVWADQQVAVETPGGGGPRPKSEWFVVLWRSHPSWRQRCALLSGSASVSTGGTGKGLLLLLIASAGAPIAFQAWPPWLGGSVLYVVAPVLVATLLGDTPDKAPRYVKLAHLTAKPRRPVWRSAVLTCLVIAAITAGFAFDPFTTRGADAGEALTLPARFRPEPDRIRGPGWAELFMVSQWRDEGGLDAVTDLGRSVRVDVFRFVEINPTHAAWPDYLAHCSSVRRAIATGQALRPLPWEPLRAVWESMLLAAKRGSGLLCLPGSDGVSAAQVSAADNHYKQARSAHDTLVPTLKSF